MAHALRYYKEIQQDNGQIIRLEIHKKDSTLPAVEIGRVLQALHLDIQGGADTIDAPIVKTSLTMAFVDAPDLEEGKKCGNWEEFYTPDSTMWKVVLKADGKTIWGGYVTPDSYQEDLRYRGSVTIIARDNIGHMQDFPFDMEGNADGMVTLEQLVNEAWAKIESPMRLDWWHEEQEAMYLMCEGNDAPSTYMNVSAFEDMNYFDAVEKALYSYGLVMRYTGSNRVTIMSLRDLPYQGKSSAPRAIEPTFLAHAQRELAPAVRRIEESVKYEFSDGVQIPLAKGVAFTGVAYTVPFYSTNVFGETTTKSIPVHAIANTDGEGWSNVPSSTLFFNPKNYTIRQTALAEDAERMLFLACNTDGSHSAIYRKTVVCADFRINMTFGRPIERDSYGGVGYCYGFSDSDDREQNGIGSLSAKSVDCYISREQNGIQQFFDGHTWSADAVLLTIEVTDRQCGIDVPLGDSSGTAEVTLTIVDVRLNDKWDFSDGLGLYIPISSMYWGVAETASLCETNNINTVYIDTNNVILEHSPELAPALDEVPFPSVIKNGIFVKSGNAYFPAKGWAWSGGTPQQMAVYNHLQLLCYHSKPNNIISGDIAYADFAEMEAIYEWGGANHLLVSGSYNFLNGRIESAVLREFKFYTDMWSDVSGTSLPETEQNNRTTAESGSGAAKASTYSNETTVNVEGGASTLAGLLDVQVSNVEEGQSLVYSGGYWKAESLKEDVVNEVNNMMDSTRLASNAFKNQGFGYSYEYNSYYENPSYDSTDFVRIGDRIKGRMFLGGPEYPRYSIIFFDANKNIISRYTGDSGKAELQDFDLTWQIPANAEFIVATNYNEYREVSYILFDGYEYAREIEAINEKTQVIPSIINNLGDCVIGEAVAPVNDNLSFGIKCNAGKVKVSVSVQNGSISRDIRWFIYRYANGQFEGTALGSITPPNTSVVVDVPEGDDGVWLFRGKETASYKVGYTVLSRLNLNVSELADEIVSLENKNELMQADIQEIKEDVEAIPELKNDILAITGNLGQIKASSIKNRISLWIDSVPEVPSYQIRVTSDGSPVNDFNIYKAASDRTGLEIIYKDAGFDTWFTIERDDNKPVLYIYNARVTDGSGSAVEYTFDFRAVDSLAQDVEKLKNQDNSLSWKGISIVCFGDSLTEFLDYTNGKSYPDYIKDLTGAEVYNLGIGGSNFRQRSTPVNNPTNYKDAYAALDIVNMVKASCEQNFTKQINAAKFLTTDQGDNNEAIVARMQTIDWSKVDVVTIFAGTNDWNNSNITSFGELTSTDINTTFGAIKEIIRLLLTTYPHIHIYWFSPTVRWLTDDNGVRTDATWSDVFERFGYTLEEFSDAILSVVKRFHLPMCDMYNTLGWNQYNFSQFFSETDGVHPRVGEGTIQIAKKMIAFINSNKTF